MLGATVESLQIEIGASASSAIDALDTLTNTLEKLKNAVKGGAGLNAVSKQLQTLNTALSSVSDENADNLETPSNGIGDLAYLTRAAMRRWAQDAISAFQQTLDSHSPSKVFEQIGTDTVLGYNIGIGSEGRKTKGVMESWYSSFANLSSPTMRWNVDTSALKYYDSSSFARNISSTVSANTSISSEGFKEAMTEFWDEYLSSMADDVRRQADKKEQTIVEIGGRTVTDVITKQKNANGFQFVTA